MIKIAIVGTGGMANAHVQSLNKIRGCTVVAGVDVHQENLQAFCDNYNIPARCPDVKTLLKDVEFDAAVVSTPDSYHVSCALPLVRAGKHVLCEKPIAPTASEGRRLVTAAKKAGTINMINFSYRNQPVLHHARKLVTSGKLGRLMHIEAHYLQTWLSSPIWGEWSTTPAWLWRCSTEHGSKGALGDIGVHIVDLTTYVANERVKRVNGLLKTFPKAPNDQIGEYKLDANDSALLRIELENGALGTVNTTRWATGQQNSLALSLYGDKGALRLDLDKSGTELDVCIGKDANTATWKTVKSPKTPNLHKRFINSIKNGINDDSDFERGWEVQKVLDATFRSDEKNQTISIRY